MQHLTEEQLVSHYYRDGDVAEARAHLATCAECRAAYERLCGVLALVDQLAVPERSDQYGDEVWRRLRWKLGSPRRRSRMIATISAVAAAIVLAFVGGIFWHSRNAAPIGAPGAPAAHSQLASTTTPGTEEPRNKVLMVVVSDHLDSSERMLLEVANADAKRPLDVADESRRAAELVSSNRIYRQTAEQRGETRIASLLSDLEPVLVELSHAGSTLSPDEVAALQKRIDAKGLLFKVRVVSQETNHESAPAHAAPKGTDTL